MFFPMIRHYFTVGNAQHQNSLTRFLKQEGPCATVIQVRYFNSTINKICRSRFLIIIQNLTGPQTFCIVVDNRMDQRIDQFRSASYIWNVVYVSWLEECIWWGELVPFRNEDLVVNINCPLSEIERH